MGKHPGVSPARRRSLGTAVHRSIRRLETLHVRGADFTPLNVMHCTVSKRDWGLRICLDPRYVNPHLQRKNFSKSRTEELFVSLNGANFYTVVDGYAAFWNLPLDRESCEMCSFSTQWGNFQFRRLPFGIVDASERFSEVIHANFSDLRGVMNCVDDLLFHGRTSSEHDQNL